MLRKEVAEFIVNKEKSVLYIASSNKNIEIYLENMKDIENKTIIKVSDIQEKDEYFKVEVNRTFLNCCADVCIRISCF